MPLRSIHLAVLPLLCYHFSAPSVIVGEPECPLGSGSALASGDPIVSSPPKNSLAAVTDVTRRNICAAAAHESARPCPRFPCAADSSLGLGSAGGQSPTPHGHKELGARSRQCSADCVLELAGEARGDVESRRG